MEAASLGSLATEVSALYGLTTSKLAIPMSKLTDIHRGKSSGVADSIATAPLKDSADSSEENYYKSLDAFNSLRNTAMNGLAIRPLPNLNSRGYSSNELFGSGSGDLASYVPTLWPIMGPITSSFGQREDPILGNGEGEFHTGIDISAPNGVPIRATGDGVVQTAGNVRRVRTRGCDRPCSHGVEDSLRAYVRLCSCRGPDGAARSGYRLRGS